LKRLIKLPQNIKDLFIKTSVPQCLSGDLFFTTKAQRHSGVNTNWVQRTKKSLANLLVPQCLSGDLFFTKALRRSEIVSVGSIFFLLALVGQTTFAQIELAPIWRTPPPNTSFKKEIPNARTNAALTPMLLPFWDDFSLNKFDGQRNTAYPNDTLWEYSQRVWVNDHMGINPPSIYVATFDGYDSLGKPYAKNDILAKGFADRLTSRPLRTDLVAQANRNNVFINFFYQIQGNGEVPDVGDVLYLYFKDKDGIWNEVWRIENDGKLDKTKFVEVKIPITDPKYFHNKFQFRFQSFGRISGPYDTWNVDYVYVSNGIDLYVPPFTPPASPKVFKDFPDRTIVSGLTPLFNEYQSIPVKHFRLDPAPLVQRPSVQLTNLRKDQTLSFGGQNFLENSSARITTKVFSKTDTTVNVTNVVLATNDSTGTLLSYGLYTNYRMKSVPSQLLAIDPTVNTFILDFTFNANSRDNLPKTSNSGDFDSIAYKRIDFRRNDTTRATYILDDYYAYDDGTAEYGARINGIGTQFAYEFNLKTNAADTIIAIDYYFPPFGDESTQSVQFHVLGALTGQETDYLYRRNTQIKRSTNNVFVRETLASPITVQGKFYIGWRLLSNALILVGLDRSFDSGSKLFYNVSGDWEQNKEVKGSLMIRPVFIRKGQPPPPVAVADETIVSLYPNPNNGVFYLPLGAEQISVVDITGRLISITTEDEADRKKISIEAPFGIYLVRYSDGQWHSAKMLVKP
jgi:hypothetical protein